MISIKSITRSVLLLTAFWGHTAHGQTSKSATSYVYCFIMGGETNLYYTSSPVLEVPFAWQGPIGDLRTQWIYYVRNTNKYMEGPDMGCSEAYRTRIEAERASAAQEATAAASFAARRMKLETQGYRLSAKKELAPWKGPSGEQWVEIEKEELLSRSRRAGKVGADVNAVSITVTENDPSARSVAAAAEKAKAVAADQRRLAETALTAKREATAIAKLKADRAAKAAAYRKRCPSLRCQ